MDPGRDLHLFDTFDGLPVKDLAIETGEASTYTNKNFKDTSIDKVIQNIGGNEQKIFYHKGYFPESASGSEDLQFALVNLDADLYNPTLAALRFFYPRLSKGGVIFIHDYNHKWEGLQKAVDEFISEIPETLVLIPDADSTVMIVKSGLEA
jgi:O-methyltransferase